MSRKDVRYRGTKCLNCEVPLDISEKYCHQCGQLNTTKKLTLADFFEEFFSNFYAYDSRLRNSILSIFTRPGILAKEFNEGKRQKYANPFRLFLSVSIVLFILANLGNENSSVDGNEIFYSTTINTKEYDAIKNKKRFIIKKDSEKYILVFHKDSIYTYDELLINSTPVLINPVAISSFRNFYLKYPEKTTETSLQELKFKNTFSYRTLFNKAKEFKSNNITGELAAYFIQKLPILIFISLPFLTIMFWLVFFSKTKNYTEHLVFTYTFYTFMFLVFIIFNLLDSVSPWLSEIIEPLSLIIILPIYLYKSLRNFYQFSRWKTILKFVLLNLLFAPFFLLSFFLIVFLGVLFF